MAQRESIRLAFVAALQWLPPRQRAVLILRDVLRWSAAEVADLLDVSVAAANGLLRRARVALRTADDGEPAPGLLRPEDRELLDRYVRAFERYDVDALVALLHEEVVLTMPPQSLWLTGRSDLRGLVAGRGAPLRGLTARPPCHQRNARVRPVHPGSRPGRGAVALALQVPTVADGVVRRLDVFTDPALFPALALPVRLQ